MREDISGKNAVYEGLREILQEPDSIFVDTLQWVADHAYYLEKEQYAELVATVHEKLPEIFRNLLECHDRESLLYAFWLLENVFDISYDEMLDAVEMDVKESKIFDCNEYPSNWVSSYFLVKAGYDYFADRRDVLMTFFPEANERIAQTFPFFLEV